MSRFIPVMLAACVAAACAPSPGASGGTGTSTGSPKPTASTKASTAPASAAPAAGNVGTMEVTVDGTPVELKGPVGRILGNNSSLLTYTHNSFEGPRDPESLEPFNSVRLVFEKTKGLKPFVLPSVKNSQERRGYFSRNGIEYNSSMTGTTDKSDTFVYEGGRVKGTWTFVTPFGAPTAAKGEIAITVDLEIPPEIQ